jgi:hypothetical protein
MNRATVQRSCAVGDRRAVRRWILAWLGAPILGIVNGATRETLYEGAVGEKAAGVISTGTLLGLLAGYMWLLERRWPLDGRREALSVGAAWAILTVGFETVFGRWVEGESWSTVLEQYDVRAGNAWAVVPASILVGPELARRFATGQHERAKHAGFASRFGRRENVRCEQWSSGFS